MMKKEQKKNAFAIADLVIIIAVSIVPIINHFGSEEDKI